ncbi:MAG: GDSL family lipase, partial [Blastocatellia bacterium]|nr:GDSL family lipase [Blastocatellia bacterium]
RETEAATTYKEFLRRYVDDARGAGARPVLVTSLARRNFKDGRIAADVLDNYAKAAREVAAEKKAPLIDLNMLSIALLNQLGEEKAAEFDAKNKDGSPDHTHLSRKGSAAFGKIVSSELVKVAPELGSLFK